MNKNIPIDINTNINSIKYFITFRHKTLLLVVVVLTGMNILSI